MPVDTAKVDGRRKINYASLEELLADAARLSSGPVAVLGNWSPGQVFKHLALAYNGSIDGLSFTLPWPVRMMARIFKNKLLSGPMPAGFKLPSDGAKALSPAPMSTEDGLADLRAAIERLQRESHRAKHPVFGELTKEQWDKLHLKHASLHMSFLVPQS
jgi:Protein of unknown function (DUF1569)